ncbi:DUF1990 family protein [Rhodococcus sp. ACPA1]|uniref:DUF1990 family protein n=1 Tax=Rhodococcus sp. ACPA1 TaxID=2028572 RepID=UPI000BB10A34|nr:DUF1990 domain-containing protein [Rhodococcus sp. ACPA1]PBC49421.1 hypothetical protein CJ177_39490 [Rhodococcus sp. ACPA1]
MGASRDVPFPAGYHHLIEQKVIGYGADAFDAAATHLCAWGMHCDAGLDVRADAPTASPGTSVELRWGIGPVRLTFSCRVVYVLDEPRRKGFAYGTLPGHPERGEESFVVEQRPDGTVLATISAFSKPGRWFTRLGGPAGRVVQRVMTRKYLEALAEAAR